MKVAVFSNPDGLGWSRCLFLEGDEALERLASYRARVGAELRAFRLDDAVGSYTSKAGTPRLLAAATAGDVPAFEDLEGIVAPVAV